MILGTNIAAQWHSLCDQKDSLVNPTTNTICRQAYPPSWQYHSFIRASKYIFQAVFAVLPLRPVQLVQ